MSGCTHNNLNTGSGGYYIICSDCSKMWVATKLTNGDADFDYERQFGYKEWTLKNKE
jgi:hypothetical protein